MEALAPEPGAVFVDATLGAAGHAEAILEKLVPGGHLIGIDRDPHALELAARRLQRFGSASRLIHGNHDDLGALLDVDEVDGIFFDLGVSSMQLDGAERGFSFRENGPLDMRMNPGEGRTAATLLATVEETELARIIWKFGEERRSRAIARAIVHRRETQPLETTRELAELVAEVAGPSARRFRIHPATRTFQALRIAVNGELERLPRTLETAFERLRRGGRLAVISFHSLEDRIVKQTFRALCRSCVCPPGLPVCGCGRPDRARPLTGGGIVPDEEEVRDNPRSRSARLRAVLRKV